MTSLTLPIPTYQCHKRVQALKIKAVIQSPRGWELHFEDARFCPIEVSFDWVMGKRATSGGYVVWYDDGYMSWSPAEAFEAGYRLATPAVVMDDETAKASMDAALWDFIDTAAMYPSVKPDPRIWDHVMVYAPASPAPLSVKVADMRESNGRITWSVFLAKAPNAAPWDCHQVYSDAIEGRARYEAAVLAHFLGLGPAPDILAFDTDPPVEEVRPVGPATQAAREVGK